MPEASNSQLLEKRKMAATVFQDLTFRFRNADDDDLARVAEIYKLNRGAWESGGAETWGSLAGLKPALLREWRVRFGGRGTP
jgi:hypothetical protein